MATRSPAHSGDQEACSSAPIESAPFDFNVLNARPVNAGAPAAAAEEPHLTGVQPLLVGVLGVGLIGFCIGTWLAPDLLEPNLSRGTHGRGGTRVAGLLNIVWSRPAGTVAGLLGLLLALASCLSGASRQEQANEAALDEAPGSERGA